MPAAREIPRIGLALGGGGARGLAHIIILEAFDELGLRPARIVGTSIGALIGAAYAAGFTAAEIRAHAEGLLINRRELVRRVLADRETSLLQFFGFRPLSGSVVDGRILARAVLPEGMPNDFKDLHIPFMAMATDFYGRCEHPLTEGPLIPALAASMALPGLISPQRIANIVLVDGGITNPLPFDRLGDVDVTIAVDVTGRPIGSGDRLPTGPELWFRSSMIMQHLIVTAKLERSPPDILVVPEVDQVKVLEFLKVQQILKATEPAKEELKRKLSALLPKPTRRRAVSPRRSSAGKRQSTDP
ncbi:NTE family protein [Rhodoligotrophos appendicifer]|uniref:patatin-like phospholipase family protein n=1 Tax=Rhodoligotrophos appendicifer TaxID=987056 RepID=UPI00118683D9|nr:patatin-like phospholipase family protein [Rhodoligotrophos appendicifer]